VIGPEEPVEPELLGVLGDPELVEVRRSELRFGEDDQSHGYDLATPASIMKLTSEISADHDVNFMIGADLGRWRHDRRWMRAG